MTSAQKIIKYIAFAFAICLIVSIFSGIINVSIGFAKFFIGNKSSDEKYTTIEGDWNITEGADVVNLDIELEYAQLIIKRGEEFKAETSDKSISVKIATSLKSGDTTLTVKEPHRWLHSTDGETVVIYVPEDTVFNKIEIESGAGTITSEAITVKELELQLGAGKTELNELTVTEKAEIKSGAGLIEINGGSINDLDIETGVGKAEIHSQLTGDCEMNIGIGSADIEIIGSKSDYKIKTSSGLGTVSVDDLTVSNNSTIGDGTNNIRISGGIGSVKIDFDE